MHVDVIRVMLADRFVLDNGQSSIVKHHSITTNASLCVPNHRLSPTDVAKGLSSVTSTDPSGPSAGTLNAKRSAVTASPCTLECLIEPDQPWLRLHGR